MTNELFTLRDAREDDMPTLNAYAYAEGMDALPACENIRVAVNEDDEVVGFLRVAFDAAGIAHVNPVVTHETWRGFGVGRALMDEALARFGELRFVSRGTSLAFYQALGYESLPWEAIKPEIAAECDECEMRDECGPVPMGKKTV